MVLRLRVPDAHSDCPLGEKYGAAEEVCGELVSLSSSQGCNAAQRTYGRITYGINLFYWCKQNNSRDQTDESQNENSTFDSPMKFSVDTP